MKSITFLHFIINHINASNFSDSKHYTIHTGAGINLADWCPSCLVDHHCMCAWQYQEYSLRRLCYVLPCLFASNLKTISSGRYLLFTCLVLLSITLTFHNTEHTVRILRANHSGFKCCNNPHFPCFFLTFHCKKLSHPE